jgi:hypothetical protein
MNSLCSGPLSKCAAGSSSKANYRKRGRKATDKKGEREGGRERERERESAFSCYCIAKYVYPTNKYGDA